MTRKSNPFVIAAMAAALASCGGGTDVASIAEADISGTGDNNVSNGNIDSFGKAGVFCRSI